MPDDKTEFEVGERDDGSRLDVFISRQCGISRAKARKAVKQGGVCKEAKPGRLLEKGRGRHFECCT